jgi:NAD(P)-dependent dehydrogenase (short-subunit alcohol dehydrogenase family)
MDTAALEAAVGAAAGTGAAGAPPLHGLVYAIGSIPLKPLKSSTAKDFMDAYALNTLGGALALKAALPALSAGGGGGTPASAVFFSTVAAAVGFTNHTAIAAAKGGVEAFVRSAAAELAPRVRVNAIAPSLSDTPLAARMLSSDATRRSLGEAHPLPRLGTADDSAAVADFLLDPQLSGWVTGQVWAVDGGRAALRPRG